RQGQDPEEEEEEDDGPLGNQPPGQEVAKFPYVEFPGQDNIPCPTCQGTGCIPAEQVNELVALIPYSDQRLRPHRTPSWILGDLLEVRLLCWGWHWGGSRAPSQPPHPVIRVGSDPPGMGMLKPSSSYHGDGAPGDPNITPRWSFFFPLGQVNFTVKVELGGPFSYVYFFCTFPRVKVHNIVIFMRTSVKLSYLGHGTQSTLETHHYVDCSTNSTAAQDLLALPSS
ncbi:Transmembrane protein 106C, partial [Chaetura pelagica]